MGGAGAEEAWDFFVSYTASDLPWARWIAWHLEDAGFRVLLQDWDAVPGVHWPAVIDRAARADARTIAVVSEAYLDASRRLDAVEWQSAWRRDPGGTERRLVPVRVEECQVEGLLADIVPADLFDAADDREAVDRLLIAVRAAGSGRAKPDVAPPRPLSALSAPSARTAGLRTPPPYREQVRQIAPLQLRGRERELAEMAGFATARSPQAATYQWWRAPAWAGKSALMAWFVLNPPSAVDVVSFFITARYAGNSDRPVFVETLTAQLAHLLDESAPRVVSDAAAETYLLDLLARAGSARRRVGRTLVVVVDGLDEDRGVTTGPEARSIAALLPKVPPPGVRIIVAGRPDPPIPSDVGADHPLRHAAIVRPLPPSPFAAVHRGDMRRELERLRRGTTLQQDLLGLIAAAGGGLSRHDFADLCAQDDVSEWDVEQELSTVAGRSFTKRAAAWRPEAPAVYVLAHEELQQDARRALGRRRMAVYHHRLHAWAESYRALGWPTDTPEYLVRGYFRFVSDLADSARMVECAIDVARHDRMLDLIGGDATAMLEVSDAQAAVLAGPRGSQLPALARLAFHRAVLVERNAYLPAGLPAVWARLGMVSRAEQLADSMVEAATRETAFADIAKALADAGRLGDAEYRARLIVRPGLRASALTTVAAARARRGNAAQALQLADTAGAAGIGTRAAIVAAVTEALVAGGHRHQAESLVNALTNATVRERARGALAVALAAAGHLALAQEQARRLTDPDQRQSASLALVEAHLRDGHVSAAREAALAMGEYSGRSDALARIAAALAEADALGPAEELARTLTGDARTAAAIAVAAAWRRAGDDTHAARVAWLAADSTPAGPGSDGGSDRKQAAVARALARAGLPDYAEGLASGISHRGLSTALLADIAAAYAEFGNAQEALRAAGTIDSLPSRANALASVATTLARTGTVDQVDTAVQALDADRRQVVTAEQAERLTDVAAALAAAGRTDAATRIAQRAESAARERPQSTREAKALTALAEALAQLGRTDHAERVARVIAEGYTRRQALSAVAEASARCGDLEGAARVAENIESGPTRAVAVTAVAVAAATAGHTDRALALVERLAQLPEQAESYAFVGRALAAAGARAAGLQALAAGESALAGLPPGSERGWALAAIAAAYVRAGDVDRGLTMVVGQPYADDQARGLAAVAIAFAESGDAGAALQGLREARRCCPESSTWSWAFGLVCAQLDDAAQLAAGARLIRSIAGRHQQAEARLAVAVALAAAGSIRGAMRTTRAIRSAPVREQALVAVASALGRAGDADRARELTRRIANPASHADVLTAAAVGLAAGGHDDRITSMVEAITASADRARALAAVSAAVLARGSEKRAIGWAHAAAAYLPSLDGHGAEAEILPVVAAALAAAGRITEARSVAAQALSVGDWRELSLHELGRAAPEALEALAEAVVGLSSAGIPTGPTGAGPRAGSTSPT